MGTILLVDVEPDRADLIAELLKSRAVPVKRCYSLSETKATIESINRPAVIVCHCELVNYSFTQLARLRHHPNVRLVFYCTDPAEKAEAVNQLPEELTEIIFKIAESCRALEQGFSRN